MYSDDLKKLIDEAFDRYIAGKKYSFYEGRILYLIEPVSGFILTGRFPEDPTKTTETVKEALAKSFASVENGEQFVSIMIFEDDGKPCAFQHFWRDANGLATSY